MRVTVAASGRLSPQDLSPEATEEFTRLFRSWTGAGGDDADGAASPD
jgi:hypothetical protein